MKKVRSLLLIFALTFMLTGCVKFNANMDIKKDKSMDFSIIYAFDTSVFGNEKLIKSEDKKDLEKQGFTVKDYSEGTMNGITISKNIKNIDLVSSNKSTKYSLSGILENKSKDDYLFEVKKGLLKNTYKAKFDFNASDSDINNSAAETTTDATNETDENLSLGDSNLTSQADEEDETATIEDETESSDTDDDLDLTNNLDLSKAATNMDLSFNVKLPYSAKSSNATTKNNDNKELSWNLSSNSEETIEFEFELYNMTNIYIGIGLIVVLILAIIAILVGKKNSKKTKGTGEAQSEAVVSANTPQETTNQNVQVANTQNINENVQVPETNNQSVAPTNNEIIKENAQTAENIAPTPIIKTEQNQNNVSANTINRNGK